MSDPRYPSSIFWSDEDEGFIATASDLPGCSAFGETEEEALAELKPAIKAWIAAATAVGNPIPKPSSPATETYSGKLLVRLPKFLHKELAHGARDQNTSLNQLVVSLLSERFAVAKTAAAISSQIAAHIEVFSPGIHYVGGVQKLHKLGPVSFSGVESMNVANFRYVGTMPTLTASQQQLKTFKTLDQKELQSA